MPTPNFRQSKETSPEDAPLAAPAQVERYKSMLPKEHLASLRNIVAGEVRKRRLDAEEGSEAWATVEAEVVANLVINDADPDEVFTG